MRSSRMLCGSYGSFTVTLDIVRFLVVVMVQFLLILMVPLLHPGVLTVLPVPLAPGAPLFLMVLDWFLVSLAPGGFMVPGSS